MPILLLRNSKQDFELLFAVDFSIWDIRANQYSDIAVMIRRLHHQQSDFRHKLDFWIKKRNLQDECLIMEIRNVRKL
jgi:hypothetical protein